MGYTDPMMVLVALLVIGLVIAVIMMMSQPQQINRTVYVNDGRDHWYHRWFNRAEEPRFRPMLY